ncbi:MAG TPA: catalase, partial [Chthoniobacterales bacterium]|nr:catalase [Chthoniobacterales bacterium]
HERIPERVVHARGAAAHGFFQVYKSLAKYTTAKVLTDPGLKTVCSCAFRRWQVRGDQRILHGTSAVSR